MDVSRQGSAESTAILNLSHPGRQWYREAQWALASSQSEGRDLTQSVSLILDMVMNT